MASTIQRFHAGAPGWRFRKSVAHTVRRLLRPWRSRGEDFAGRWPRLSGANRGAPVGRLQAYIDAHTRGPGIWKWQHYAEIYERHCGKFCGRPLEILEIGIYSGGSLAMWQYFFGPQCRVTGVDIEPAVRAYEAPGIRVLVGDQADTSFWARELPVLPKFDLVIDDGGHEAYQQATTMEAVLPHMNSGGVYICEDIHGTRQPLNDYLSAIAASLNAFEVKPATGDDIHVNPTAIQSAVRGLFLYPFVAVIELRESQVEELVCPRRGTEWQPFYEEHKGHPTLRRRD